MTKIVKRDRISDLPTDIKQNILSFLCMKDAIATSCLSPGWRYCWLTLPFFDFGNQFYHQFAKYFKTLPKNHPKRQHLYHSFSDNIESTDVDDDDDDDDDDDYYEYTDDIEDYGDDIPDWKIQHIGYVQLLDQILQIYIKNRQPEVFLKKLSIYVPINPCDSKPTAYASNVVSQWLLLAKHRLEELTCNISGSIIPDGTLQNCNGILNFKTLTNLELQECNLTCEDHGDVLIDLPYLKQLSFKDVHIHQKLLDILLSKCGALEKLTLSFTKGVKVFRVPRLSKLKEVSLMDIPLLNLVEINAMALQCLTLHQLNKCKVKVASNSCKTLAALCIIGCAISDDLFNNVTEFPHLETVSLLDCPTLKHIKITSNCLATFCVERCPNLDQIELNTPNLSSFRYSTAGNTNIVTLLSKCQIASVSLLIMRPREASFDQHLWDSKLIALLTNFSQSEYVHLATNSKKEIVHLTRLARKLLPSNFQGPRFFPFSYKILNMSYSSAIFG